MRNPILKQAKVPLLATALQSRQSNVIFSPSPCCWQIGSWLLPLDKKWEFCGWQQHHALPRIDVTGDKGELFASDHGWGKVGRYIFPPDDKLLDWSFRRVLFNWHIKWGDALTSCVELHQLCQLPILAMLGFWEFDEHQGSFQWHSSSSGCCTCTCESGRQVHLTLSRVAPSAVSKGWGGADWAPPGF